MHQGLTAEQSQANISKYGFNEIVDTSRPSVVRILVRQIRGNFIIYMLGVSVIISFLVGKNLTAYTIFAVILSVVIVGFFQEYNAEDAIASLKKMLMPFSIVYRNGKKTEIPSRELVPEDIIVLGNGEKVPADCEIIESFDLRLNEAALTGESSEISKILQSTTQNPEQNLIFMGTYIVNGRCIAKVTHTGMNTRFGKIANLISTAEKELPLQKKVNEIAKYMVFIAIITSIATGMLMAFRAPALNASTISDILILIVALSVSAFPEGFPVVLATTLALGAKRMSKQNAIVNRMSIIETLGEVTVICTDKTGTLTKGEMTVKFVYTNEGLYEAEGSGFDADGQILHDGKGVDVSSQIALKKLIEAVVFCNDASIERTGEDNEYKTFGTPTEAALLILGAKAGIFQENVQNKRISEYPFNSDRKLMSVMVEFNGMHVAYIKGAPEILLEKCTKQYKNGTEIPLTDQDKNKVLSLQKEMSSTAYRTLAAGYKTLNTGEGSYQEDDFVLLGLVAMEDPPRENAAESITIAQNAGIRVLMVTGDNKETAISIANQIGLTPKVLEGYQIDQQSDEELKISVQEYSIFARVKPEHKIRLVRVLKDLEETVTMTGDGVNDAPALKEAHVGIAMGKNGTDVSRSAADLVLKDDNFATIVLAITEGRTVYNNIRKFVTYQLSCSFAELLALFLGALLAPFFGWQIPLLVSMQILFMNLVTDNMPAITLGANPTSGDIMTDKPRKKENLLNRNLILLLSGTGVIMGSATVVSYFIAFNYLHMTHETSRTIAMVTLILVEIVTAFSYRSFRKLIIGRSLFVNKYLMLASVLSILFTFIILYTPVKVYFETVSIGVMGWAIALLCASVVLLINDFIKVLNLKNPSYVASTK